MPSQKICIDLQTADGHADRQTDRQTGRQAGRQADRQTGRQTAQAIRLLSYKHPPQAG